MQILHKKDIVRQYACLTVPFMQYLGAKMNMGKRGRSISVKQKEVLALNHLQIDKQISIMKINENDFKLKQHALETASGSL